MFVNYHDVVGAIPLARTLGYQEDGTPITEDFAEGGIPLRLHVALQLLTSGAKSYAHGHLTATAARAALRDAEMLIRTHNDAPPGGFLNAEESDDG